MPYEQLDNLYLQSIFTIGPPMQPKSGSWLLWWAWSLLVLGFLLSPPFLCAEGCLFTRLKSTLFLWWTRDSDKHLFIVGEGVYHLVHGLSVSPSTSSKAPSSPARQRLPRLYKWPWVPLSIDVCYSWGDLMVVINCEEKLIQYLPGHGHLESCGNPG